MKRFAMSLDLVDKLDSIEKYKKYHQNVWPEVKKGLLAIGILDMDIYLLGNRLFMVIHTPDDFDINKDFQKYTESSKKAAEWDNLMRDFQQRTPFTKKGDWWAPMEKVFELHVA
jgi:L-rhamnose mutarotase